MQIYSVLGAPRKNGNTERLWTEFMKGLEDKKPSAQVNKLILRDENIGYCTGCQACFSTGVCTVKDRMTSCLEDIRNSDVMVLATPVYNMSMSAQMKTFIDRLTPFYMKKELTGKKVVLLTTYGDDDEVDSGAGALVENIKMFCDIHGMKFLYHFGVSAGEGINSVSQNTKVLDEAFKRALEL